MFCDTCSIWERLSTSTWWHVVAAAGHAKWCLVFGYYFMVKKPSPREVGPPEQPQSDLRRPLSIAQARPAAALKK